MAERRVAQIMRKAYGVSHVFAQPPAAGLVKPAADRGGYGRHVKNVFYARADMVIIRRKKNLGFMLQPAERERVDYFCLVAEIFAAQI
ncbi:hypothetical protein FACS189437_01250 [Bacteroidia bacterium]|nr:hypothetical protein FACS189437_01250 [Bacteroidia bacterium]